MSQDENNQRLRRIGAVSSIIAAISSVTTLALVLLVMDKTMGQTSGPSTTSTDMDEMRPNQAEPVAASRSVVEAPASKRSAEVPSPKEVDQVPYLGQSVGYPTAGSLFDGRRFPPGDGYVVRNFERAWATRNTIDHVRKAFADIHARHPNARRYVIGDLSWRTGGRMEGHRSHQSGRDVDIIFVRKRPALNGAVKETGRRIKNGRGSPVSSPYAEEHSQPTVSRTQPDQSALSPLSTLSNRPNRLSERNRSKKQIQLNVLLDLIIALCRTHDEPTGVEWMMLDYTVQNWLVSYGERHGYESSALSQIFQVPNGPAAPVGIVKHYPGHMDHLHVRFKCPPDDRYCQSPQVGPSSHFDSIADERTSHLSE